MAKKSTGIKIVVWIAVLAMLGTAILPFLL